LDGHGGLIERSLRKGIADNHQLEEGCQLHETTEPIELKSSDG
jgi:hypothetical protein